MKTPLDSLRIDPARSEDLDALLALEQDSFPGDRLSRRQYRHHLRSASARVLTVRDGMRLVGAAVLLFRRGSRVARLYSLAVDRTARGRGVGRLLLAETERLAHLRGCIRLRLEVREDNPAAHALYERCGLRQRGVRPNYYEDGTAARLYEKVLSPVTG